jgi:hypothetical protein
MSALTNQTSLSETKSFFASASGGGGGGGGGSGFGALLCSTLTAAVSVTTPSLQTSNINGSSYLINGVGNNLDVNRSLQTTPNYGGTNAFWNITNNTSGAELDLDPPQGGVVGGRWAQMTTQSSNAPYQIRALPAGVGENYETIEVIQGTDTTSRLYFYSGSESEGLLATQWQKVSGTYTKECSFAGYQVGPLSTGTQTFSTPQAYVSGQFLPYRITANGRVSFNAGTADSDDSVSIAVGLPTFQPGFVVGTNLILGQAGRTVFPWSISGTISDPNGALTPINTVYTDTNLGSNASYDLFIDSFTVAQL